LSTNVWTGTIQKPSTVPAVLWSISPQASGVTSYQTNIPAGLPNVIYSTNGGITGGKAEIKVTAAITCCRHASSSGGPLSSFNSKCYHGYTCQPQTTAKPFHCFSLCSCSWRTRPPPTPAFFSAPITITSLSNGLVGYWPLDGAVTNWNTSTTLDLSGNGNDGSLINMATSTSPTAGKIGQALKFDSVDGEVDAGASASLNDLGPMTVSAWIKPTSINSLAQIVSKSVGGVDGAWFLRVQAPGLCKVVSASYIVTFSKADSDGVMAICRASVSDTIVLNTWQLITATWDGSSSGDNIHLHKNGVEVS
jgi:hypothetical protein